MIRYPYLCRACHKPFDSAERSSARCPNPDCPMPDNTRRDWKRAAVSTTYHPTKGAKL